MHRRGRHLPPGRAQHGHLHVAQNWLLPPFDSHLERFSLSFVLFEAKRAAVLQHLVDLVESAAGVASTGPSRRSTAFIRRSRR